MSAGRNVLVSLVFILVVFAVWITNNNIGDMTIEMMNTVSDRYTIFKEPVFGENNLIFLETSCAVHCADVSAMILTPRQACAVESAAFNNPDAAVYLLHSGDITSDSFSTAPEYVRQLLSYNNIHMWHLTGAEFFSDTPLYKWFHEGHLNKSRYPMSHTSDVYRYVSLWKYGGTYMDLDVIVVRSLSGMSNFAGAESQADVAAGVLNFAHNGSGHEMATACLEDLRTRFRGDDWGNNGPGVITRVLKRTCGVHQVRDMTPERCQGFTVHTPSAFYPIPWRQWKLYFDEKSSKKVMSRINASLAIHVWNKFSVVENITVGSKQPYGLIAQKYCPKVYSHCGKIF